MGKITITEEDGFEMVEDVMEYDFAMITLNSSISFSSTILPACLPKDSKNEYTWERARTSGWGLLQNDDYAGKRTGRKKVNKLMRVDLTVLPYSLCKNASKYENQRSDNDTEKYIDPSHMLCVGSAKPVPWKAAKGIWQGDSGGRYFVSKHCKIYYDYNRKPKIFFPDQHIYVL